MGSRRRTVDTGELAHDLDADSDTGTLEHSAGSPEIGEPPGATDHLSPDGRLHLEELCVGERLGFGGLHTAELVDDLAGLLISALL